MAQSLVTLVMQQFAPTVVGKLAGAVGESQGATEKAVSGGVPALLAGLVSVASKPGGADRLAGAVQRQDPGILDNLSDVLGSGTQQTSKNGRSAVSSLLGGAGFDGLTGAIGSFAGINRGSAGSLIGLVAPIVMGVLGRQQKAAGTDAGGLARMLVGEKDAIAAAIPPGMSKLLGGSDILDSVRDRLAPATGAAAKPAGSAAAMEDVSGPQSASPPPASETVHYYAQKPPPARPRMPLWPLGLLAVLILAVLGYWLWGPQAQRQVAQQPVPPAPQTAQQQPANGGTAGTSTPPTLQTAQQQPANGGTAGTSTPPGAPSVMVGNVDVGHQLAGVVDRTSQTLKGVTDASSAKNALPQLKDQIAQLDKVNGLANQAPGDGKHALSGIVASGMPTLQQLMDKAKAIPGAPGELTPTLDALRTKLSAIGSQA